MIQGLKRAIFLSDVHRPFHDVKAWKLVVKVVTALKPEYLVVVGDFIDNYAVTQHDKSYGRQGNFQDELDDANKGLDSLDLAAPQATKIYIEGNHEDRWPRYLAKIAPEDNRRDNNIRNLLQLDKRGWKFVPYKEHIQIGKVYITHDTGKAGKYAIHSALDDFQSNVVIGHLHRMGVVYAGDARGKTHVAASFGWLGDAKQVDYMHRIKALRDWTLGFGVGYLLSDGLVKLDAIPILPGYRAVVEGKLYV